MSRDNKSITDEIEKLETVEALRSRLKSEKGYGRQIVASFDACGVGAISQLEMLLRLCAIIAQEDSNSQDATIADVLSSFFDLMCGSGAGALPPFLLSRLQFDIRNAYLEFVKLAEKNSKRRPPWAKRLSAQWLHDWIKSLVKNAEQLPFEHTWQAVDRRCQTAIVLQRQQPEDSGSKAKKASGACMLRTYNIDDHERTTNDPILGLPLKPVSKFPLCETAAAAMATPGVLSPVVIPHSSISYRSAATKINNPIAHALREGSMLYDQKARTSRGSHRSGPGGVGLIVSFGAGIKAPTSFISKLDVVRRTIYAAAQAKLLPGDEKYRALEQTLQNHNITGFRFDGPDLSDCELHDWSPRNRDKIIKRTRKYLQRPEVRLKMIQLARLLVAFKRGREAKLPEEELYGYEPFSELCATDSSQSPSIGVELQATSSSNQRTSVTDRSATWTNPGHGEAHPDDVSRRHTTRG